MKGRRERKGGLVWEAEGLEEEAPFSTYMFSYVCSFSSLGCVQRGEESSPLSLSSHHFPFPQRHAAA